MALQQWKWIPPHLFPTVHCSPSYNLQTSWNLQEIWKLSTASAFFCLYLSLCNINCRLIIFGHNKIWTLGLESAKRVGNINIWLQCWHGNATRDHGKVCGPSVVHGQAAAVEIRAAGHGQSSLSIRGWQCAPTWHMTPAGGGEEACSSHENAWREAGDWSIYGVNIFPEQHWLQKCDLLLWPRGVLAWLHILPHS